METIYLLEQKEVRLNIGQLTLKAVFKSLMRIKRVKLELVLSLNFSQEVSYFMVNN